MSEIKLKDENAMNGLYDEIKTLVIHSRSHIVTEINSNYSKLIGRLARGSLRMSKIILKEQNMEELY